MFKYLLTTLISIIVTIFTSGCFGSSNATNTSSTATLQSFKENVATTGQTTCYNKNYPVKYISCTNPLALHDDGWYAKIKHIAKASKYTTNKHQTIITDHLTGLMWQNTPDEKSTTWQAANNYCHKLALGSYHNWRLPNIKELETIVDYGQSAPAIYPIFSHTHSAYYWTSRTSEGIVWNIDFNHGSNINYYSTTQNAYVRCVRKG